MSAKILIGDANIDRTENGKFKSEYKINMCITNKKVLKKKSINFSNVFFRNKRPVEVNYLIFFNKKYVGVRNGSQFDNQCLVILGRIGTK